MLQQYKKLWITLLVMIMLSPMGLIATGTAFGEWGLEELEEEVGFIPRGLAGLAEFWEHSPLPDYSIPGFSETFMQSAVGYIISAVVGVLLVVAVLAVFSRIVKE